MPIRPPNIDRGQALVPWRFNEDGVDQDFAIEGDTDAALFHSDASMDGIGIGTATPGLPGLNNAKAWALSGVLSPTALSGDVNNYAPTGLTGAVTVLRVNTGASARNMTGLGGGVAGRILWLINISTSADADLTLKHASGSSSAANRFNGVDLADTVVRPGGAICLWYDGTSSLWRPLGI